MRIIPVSPSVVSPLLLYSHRKLLETATAFTDYMYWTVFGFSCSSISFWFLTRDVFVRTNRRVIAMLFVRLSVRLSLWDGRAF